MHDDHDDPVPFFCKALYDYQSTDASSLSFRTGEIIEVLTTLASGWWDGLLNGDARGWFPSNYVARLSARDADALLRARPPPRSTASVTPSEALGVLGRYNAFDRDPDWLADQMEYANLGRDTFSELAHTSLAISAQPNDFWMPQVTADGQIYYLNSQTGERARELPYEDLMDEPTNPAHLTRQPTSASYKGVVQKHVAGDAWIQRMADSGVYYYENQRDGSVSWTLPTPEDTAAGNITANPGSAGMNGFRSPMSSTFTRPGTATTAMSSFIDDRAPSDSDLDMDADGYLNRLSVYSDDSDVKPPSPPPASFPALDKFPDTPLPSTFQGDQQHALDLQDHLAVPSPLPLADLFATAQAAVRAVLQSATRTMRSQALENWDDRPSAANDTALQVSSAVVAVRNLLSAFTAMTPEISLNPENASDDADSIRHPFRPYQRKVAATLSKLVLSARSISVNSDWTHGANSSIEQDGRELENAIDSFVREVEKSGADSPRRLHGVLVSLKGMAGIGLGSMGASAAGAWSGLGFVDCDTYPSEHLRDELSRSLRVHATQCVSQLDLLFAALSRPDIASSGKDAGATMMLPTGFAIDTQLPADFRNLADLGRAAVESLAAFTNAVAQVNFARIDVDGVEVDPPSASRSDCDAYALSVRQAHAHIRALEANLQAVTDDTAALLLASQEVTSAVGFRVSETLPALAALASSLSVNATRLADTVAMLCNIYESQMSSTLSPQSNLDKRVPERHRAALAKRTLQPTATPAAMSISTDFSLPLDLDSTDMMDMMDDSAVDGADDDYVDMALAFGTGGRRPTIPVDFEPTALFYEPPPEAAVENDVEAAESLPEIEESPMDDHKRSRTTSQSTTTAPTAAVSTPAAALQPQPSTSTLILPEDDASPLFEDDDISPAMSPRKAPKIKQFFGEDAPQYLLSQLKQAQPWYLRPGYAPSDVIINPDGGVRGGTVPALIERLTMHDYRDALFISSFLMTFKSFTTLREMSDLLIARFNIAPPTGLTSEQLREWAEKKQAVIRIRVINIFKSMLTDDDIVDKDDTETLDRIKSFATDAQRVVGAAKQLLVLIERLRQGGDAAIKLRVHTPNFPPAAIIPKPMKKLRLLDIDPLELARQITLMESKLFCKIRPSEVLQRARQDSVIEGVDNVKSIISTSNKIADWVADSILCHDHHSRRAAVIKHFIAVAERCRSLHNFSTMAALIAGLNSPPIRRLKRTWDQVNQRLVAVLDSVEQTLDSGRSFSNYKAMLTKVDPPCVPFLGVYLTVLTFIQDGSPDILKEGNLVNFHKRHKAGEVMREIKQFQSKPYNLTPVPSVLSYVDESLAALRMTADEFWTLSLAREPREKEDEKMQRMLSESGFM